ncbi:MAG: hypothetical protein LBT40_05835 [Deltaproteobacteria bacterium]|nr:hypothetical protein [Deltaproteobacteria bacterium]
MRSLTVNLDLRGASALVIGCGRVGRRKLARLLGTGARIVVVEPSPSSELLDLRDSGEIELHEGFAPEFLDGCRVVMAAAGVPVPPEVLMAAREGRVLLNSADDPALGTFTLPAAVEDGALNVSVSTGGAFPALSAAIAARLRESFRGWGGYVDLLGRLRPMVLASGLPRQEIRGILKRLAEDGELPGLIVLGLRAEALSLMGRLAAPFEIPEDLAWPGETLTDCGAETHAPSCRDASAGRAGVTGTPVDGARSCAGAAVAASGSSGNGSGTAWVTSLDGAGSGTSVTAGVTSLDGAGSGTSVTAGVSSLDGAGSGTSVTAGVTSLDGAGSGPSVTAGVSSLDGAGSGTSVTAGVTTSLEGAGAGTAGEPLRYGAGVGTSGTAEVTTLLDRAGTPGSAAPGGGSAGSVPVGKGG